MRRLAFLTLSVVALIVVAGVFFNVDVRWNRQASYICNQEREMPAEARTASGYSIQWEWREIAYVCSYHAPGEPEKRVGFTDAFS
jgi:hypothetical protein